MSSAQDKDLNSTRKQNKALSTPSGTFKATVTVFCNTLKLAFLSVLRQDSLLSIIDSLWPIREQVDE
jgi:hypothetical protein